MDIQRFLDTQQLPLAYADTAQKWFEPLCERIKTHQKSAGQPFVVGINGSQGSGKSTLTAFISAYLENEYDLKVVALSIDDFYFDKSHRNSLATKFHPLLATRGVPGTHDIRLAMATIKGLKNKGDVAIPRFNKATDNPFPKEHWPRCAAPVDVIILEGWCVGVQPQAVNSVREPINLLEENHDSLGIWRNFVNTELAGAYQELFAQIDYQVMLKAPSFDCVFHWRLEQEDKLRSSTHADSSGIMSETQIATFIQHYQRLTEHALATLPATCDTVFSLNEDRVITSQDVTQ
ncbi:kinase [Alteromonas sp. 345S023]|uniref:Kinase n=1 Tax=Alteromonas profundi TaxID=2696062 RepID=A0A7X5RMV2_9ALTE|nr:P-loop NTPase fold protein [Alteromonas profundi]NDV92895.1 kinase [Alteromonas profundi]